MLQNSVALWYTYCALGENNDAPERDGERLRESERERKKDKERQRERERREKKEKEQTERWTKKENEREGERKRKSKPRERVTSTARVHNEPNTHSSELNDVLITRYGIATISRLLKIIGLFCKRAL